MHEMRVVIPKNGDATERAMGTAARYKYSAAGKPVARGTSRGVEKWLLEVNSAEVETIGDHVGDGDIVNIKPINEPANSSVH